MEDGEVGSSNTPSPAVYIYQLPYGATHKLCNIFDQNGGWRKLGAYMKYDDYNGLAMVQCSMYKGKYPTSVIISKWGDLNHSVLELFVSFSHMKHYRAIALIKQFVNEKYDVLMRANIQKLDPRIKQLYITKMISKNDGYRAHPCNFDIDHKKVEHDSKEKSKLQIIFLSPMTRRNVDSYNNLRLPVYIHQLPYGTIGELCHIFDRRDEWRKLGAYMKYDQTCLAMVQRSMNRGKSPTSVLLSKWGDLNHTVLELFVLLSRMEHYRAMAVIKHFVDEKYYVLMEARIQKLDPRMEQLYILKTKSEKNECQVLPCNFNTDNKDSQHVSKKLQKLPIVSIENNEDNSQSVMHKYPVDFGRCEMFSTSDRLHGTKSAGILPSIPYKELQKSTNNWDEKFILGSGGFGKVFKGIWKYTQVAIKRLDYNDKKTEFEQFKHSITELQCLNAYRHDNIIQLYGYSFGGPHHCLIYQYMAGGSLDNRLRTRNPQESLDWTSRLNIAVGTARGLQFLHTIDDNAPLVHGDLKSANILLDANDHPRIGDFGSARRGIKNKRYGMMSRIYETKPYLQEEFWRSRKQFTKIDTFSFGVVLFELCTALAPFSMERKDHFLSDYIVNYKGNELDLKDPQVPGFDEYIRGVMRIGKMCIRTRARDRPDMISVLQQLEKIIFNK